MDKIEKIVPFTSLKPKEATLNSQGDGIMESRNTQEEAVMPRDNYTKSEIDLKFQNLEQKTDAGFEKIDLKIQSLEQNIELRFDNFEKRVENLFLLQDQKRLEEKLQEREQAKKDKKEIILWLIGTAIAILAIIVPILFSKK